MIGEETAEPANGSWVAELEEARLALSKLAADDADDGVGVDAVLVLEAHLRVCRAYSMLRKWERLIVAAKRGLIQCSSYSSLNSPSPDPGKSRFDSSFRQYRKRARAELSVESLLSRPLEASAPFRHFGEVLRHQVVTLRRPIENMYYQSSPYISNANIFQSAAVLGDVRCMEAAVALGAALDLPFGDASNPTEGAGPPHSVALPPGASALILACVALATAEAKGPAWVYARRRMLPRAPGELDGVEECAMQLVRLGADPNRILHLGRDPASKSIRAMDGKTAFQIAAMSTRRALVALMWEHMQMTPKERVEVAHCRCGSRLPWKKCHSTGPGQPSHYLLTDSSDQTYYRVSPMARCPCRNAKTTYYKCCWSDNRAPVYLIDQDGCRIHTVGISLFSSPFGRHLQNVARDDPSKVGIFEEYVVETGAWGCVALFRESPSHFQALCVDAGPKSNMTSWDPIVYAGCLERLEIPFLWKDVHWDLDRTELLRRAAMWNAALEKYCDEAGLSDEERDRVVEKHRANPCGPCARVGCGAFEEEVREFRRCARCKLVAYCGRKCQSRDWAAHRNACTDSSRVIVLPKRVDLAKEPSQQVS